MLGILESQVALYDVKIGRSLIRMHEKRASDEAFWLSPDLTQQTLF